MKVIQYNPLIQISLHIFYKTIKIIDSCKYFIERNIWCSRSRSYNNQQMELGALNKSFIKLK